MTVDFIGAGWNFPLQVDVTNAIALATHARDIEQAIELIIRTAPGERPMRPEFRIICSRRRTRRPQRPLRKMCDRR